MPPLHAESRSRRSGPWLELAGIVVAALLLAAIYAPYGYSGVDEAFVTALAWRVLNGELPYTDFIYVRPPGTPLLHAGIQALLPASSRVIAERFLLFIFVALYSWVAARTLEQLFRFEQRGLPVALLTVAGFVFALQGFPPMPWHTVDGILLGTLGIAALARRDATSNTLLGATLVFGAALCKQSFAFLLPMTLIYLAVTGSRRRVAEAALVWGVLGALLAAVAASLGLLGAAVDQMTGQTRLASLIGAGAMAYVRPVLPLAGALAGVVGSVELLSRAAKREPNRAVYPYLVVGLAFGAATVQRLVQQRFEGPAFNYPALVLLLGAGALLWELGSRRRGPWTLALLFGLGWCASLSWGYPTPILLGVPLVFGLIHAASEWTGARPGPLAGCVLGLGLIAQLVAYEYPYGDARRRELTADLGQAFPRLAGVVSSSEQLARHRELRELAERYGDRFAVLPAMPLAYFLTDTHAPIAVDWARNTETDDRTPELVAQLERSGVVAFVEQGPRSACAEGPACSALTAYVVEHWTAVQRGRYFVVYRAPSVTGVPTGQGTGAGLSSGS